jgi:hypothetical protein
LLLEPIKSSQPYLGRSHQVGMPRIIIARLATRNGQRHVKKLNAIVK